MDALTRLLAERPEYLARRREGGTASGVKADYRDVVPEHPLRIALYSEEHARELIEGSGRRAMELVDPGPYIQHSFVCEPV